MTIWNDKQIKVNERERLLKERMPVEARIEAIRGLLSILDEGIASQEAAEIKAAQGTKFHIEQELKEYRVKKLVLETEKEELAKKLRKFNDEIKTLDDEIKILDSSASDESSEAETRGNSSENDEGETSKNSDKKGEASSGKDSDNKATRNKNRVKTEQAHNRESYSQYHSFYQQLNDFEKRRDDYAEQSVDSSSSSSEAIQIESLLRDSDPIRESIKTTLLYVATFFEQLSVQDFSKVVEFLLEPQVVHVSTKVSNEKGEEKPTEEIRTYYLSQIWNADSQKQSLLMKECHLKALRLKDSRKIIDFSVSYLRQDAKKVFEEDYASYLEKQFKRVRFLLLDSSNEIVFNVINISSEMALSDPSVHACPWLKLLYELLRSSELILKNLANSDSEKSQEYLEFLERTLDSAQKEDITLFNRFLFLSDWNKNKEFVFWKLSALIAQMCQHPRLQSETEDFLHWAINEQDFQYNQGYEYAVLEIIKPLDSIPNFDQVDWIKQLIDRSRGEIGFKSYVFLRSNLAKSGSNIYKLLRNIKKWLPKLGLDPDEFSDSNIYALQLIFDYSFEVIDDLGLKDFGCWPSKYNLFIFPENDSIDSNLRILAEWMFYPSIKHILNRGVKIEDLASSLLKDWFNVLWGFGKEPQPEAVQTTKRLLSQVLAVTNRTQQNELMNFWNEMGEKLLDQADKLSENDDDSEADKERKLCMHKYKNLKHLKNQFKELQIEKSV